MEYIVKGYEPKAIFQYFEEISAIPRSSGNEKGMADYLEVFAKKHNLFCYRDEIHNVIIKKAGSAGCEGLPAVMLQGHTDMVCEKNAGTAHDFEKEGIKLEVKDGYLCAKGTTLGADNGIAVALMLAVLADDSLKHPPLECVFTVQEETGLFGAVALDGGVLSARTMINLDSEEEGIATVSCAGGMRIRLHKTIDWVETEGAYGLQVAVRGLLGGHSGADIHLEHANANKVMGRILYSVLLEVDANLVTITGGSKDNAIARECDCTLAFHSEEDLAKAKAIITAAAEDIHAELAAAEPDFRVELAQTALPQQMMSKDTTDAIVKLVFLAPNGMRKRNVLAGNFVVCSVNLGVITTDDTKTVVYFSPRSSVASLQQETKKELTLLSDLFGCKLTCDSEYPGWSYAENSHIRDVLCESYRKLFGGEMKIEAIHAGLECGLFIDKLPGLDAIAIGPTMYGCHTPDERLELASCERFWKLLIGVLEDLTKKQA
ncbi:aminoacyl-histidine dipeptidase [Hydrogenoanaerobacterium sp.]|uniref:aminoacyl-histidine dipeptidase n=1 Tax=Hydrogenoanaerobacterium sp. TaxID=2953763 RepID=UPI00289B4FF0|nr:aminoacyl-histidine dipeptidase [Hydrogenoanaerobacterium sp.]